MTIYNKSSEDMSEIKDNSVHLVVTSPPYPMIKKWDELFIEMTGIDPKDNPREAFAKQHKIISKVLSEIYRILVNGGIACINIGDATRSLDGYFCCWPNFSIITIEMFGLGFIPIIPIIWRKISNRKSTWLGSSFQCLPPNGYIMQDCEYIAIYRKGESIRKFKTKDENRYNSMFTREERHNWFQQVWDIKGERGAKKTSAFPYEIPYRLIRMFSCIGEVVLDPFTGTGTTMKAAKDTNRTFIGYELQ